MLFCRKEPALHENSSTSIEVQSIADDCNSLENESVVPTLSTRKKFKSSISTKCQENDLLKKAAALLNKEEDEWDVYGKHISNEIRAINNPNIRIQTKRRINEVLYEAQAAAINSSITFPWNPPSNIMQNHIVQPSCNYYSHPQQSHQIQGQASSSFLSLASSQIQNLPSSMLNDSTNDCGLFTSFQ